MDSDFDFSEFEDLLEIDTPTPPPVPFFTPSGFVEVANQIFETASPLVEIEGEVSSFKVNQGKFVFFDLKDESSTLPCFMMAYTLRLPLEDGMRVVVTARPKITDWGKFSLTIVEVKPRGEGQLKRSFDILRQKLAKEGIFDDELKRPIPVGAQNIAVISSTQAAGYADFVEIINQRWGGLRVQVAHTQVQGVGAADQIVRAIEYFNSLEEDAPEVIAIVRGGGSIEDLASFNDEMLVRAIAESRIPIIVGVGHETDETLADLAADLAAATPSHAAQILTPDGRAEIEFLRERCVRAGGMAAKRLREVRERIRGDIVYSFENAQEKISLERYKLEAKKRLLESLNPEVVLAKGYAILRGEALTGGDIEIELNDKIITAEVKNVRKK